MLMVKTKLGNSHIHGVGLFADQAIGVGDVVWKFEPTFDLTFAANAVLSMPSTARVCIAKYGYLSSKTKRYILDADDARFFNHSESPNCKTLETLSAEENEIIATRNIICGEELTINYNDQESNLDDTNLLKQIYRDLNLDDEVDPRLK